jgi:chromosome segregation protein
VHFQRLRLSGFKSFVEPTEFRIEPGLTGVVGPNGCGKSNVLEGLRWVMGAASAKAMRAGGMDDVIFSGTGARPSRNHAEVSLTIDNADHTAPAQFANDPVIEVVRRIDRGAGSTYRINGREVRARDVQLLFADASTGANSPALVRQGQISELIAAKPQNRRLILEEAAGVSGLHSRRHEAELRLRAAEANMARLDDVARELDTALARLKREARQAEKYKLRAAQIRALQSGLLFARWRDAVEALERAEAEAKTALDAVETTARDAAAAAVEAEAADGAVAPLREEAQIAGAVRHRLALEADRVEREAAHAIAEVGRLTAELTRIDADAEREAQIIEDAGAALARLGVELAELEREIESAPERLPALEAAWKAADAERRAADQAVETLAAALAAADAERRAAAQRVEEAQGRLARSQRALDAAKVDRAAIGPTVDPAADLAKAAFQAALEKLRQARAALTEAEAAQTAAAQAEAAARDGARKAEDQLGRLRTEARGLAQLTAGGAKADYPPALDQVEPQPGYEAALAAALGDELNAALDARAVAHWAGRDAQVAADWPKGCTALAPLIKAPPALAARLALTAVVDRKDGPALQGKLPVGARIVSKEGDLWRWDGFTVRAEAPRPAAIRLEQRRRLAQLEAEIDRLAPAAVQAAEAHQAARAALSAAEDALRAARRGPEAAERVLGAAREEAERFERETARREARAASLDDTIARFEAELAETRDRLAEAVAAEVALEPAAEAGGELGEARAAAQAAREAAAAARAALARETRERTGRLGRLDSVRRDHADWSRRSEAAARRIETLARDRAEVAERLEGAREAPQAIEQRREKLLDELSTAEARQTKANDALEAGEARRAAAERAARTADSAAAEAREQRAAIAARQEAAAERAAEHAAAIREATHLEPEALGARLAEDAIASPRDAAGVEQHLSSLERDRDAIGAVNLRAEEEAAEYLARLNTMRTERADLAGAISRLRGGIETLNSEGRERLIAAFDVINGHFQTLFAALFGGGQAELRLVESDDPLEAGLEIFACPPGKRLAAMSLMSGGEQALTAAALIFGVFLANPAPICVLDEVDAPLDDANVERFCNMLDEMRQRTGTRFIAITHNPVTMARMDRLYGVTMPERGVSQLVSVDLRQAEAMAAQ